MSPANQVADGLKNTTMGGVRKMLRPQELSHPFKGKIIMEKGP